MEPKARVIPRKNRYRHFEKEHSKKASPRARFSQPYEYDETDTSRFAWRQWLTVILLSAAVLGGAGYWVVNSVKKVVADNPVISQSQIDVKVKKLTGITESPLSIERVMDSESARNYGPVYEGVQEGDYIVRYPSAFVVYSLLKNKIMSVSPRLDSPKSQ